MAIPVIAAPVIAAMYTALRWFGGFLFAKAVVGLGVGSLTFWGYLELMEYLEGEVVSAWSGIPATALAYLTIAGFTDGLGIILAAISVRGAIVFTPKLGLLYTAVST